MSNSSGIQGITEADIANYLANNPSFFERHAELLASVQLTSPHGQRAVSLQERQMEMLRQRIKGLEQQMVQMIRNAQDNVGIAENVQHWVHRLLLTADAAALPEVAAGELQRLFMIPQVALRLWDVDATHAELPCCAAVGADCQAQVAALDAPYCGARLSGKSGEPLQWLAEPAAVMSMALVPLRTAEDKPRTFGALLLASGDATRYSADMGTEFLLRVGSLASAALQRLLPPA